MPKGKDVPVANQSIETLGQDSHECPGCTERDERILELEESLSQLRGKRHNLRPALWWLFVFLGLSLFGFISFPIMFFFPYLFEGGIVSGTGSGVLVCSLMGMSIGLPIAQTAIVGITITLTSWPFPKRIGITIVLASVLTLGYSLSGFHFGFLGDMNGLLPAIPMVALVAMLPIGLMRSLYRWTIVSRGSEEDTRPITLGSMFVLVGLVAGATVLVQNADASGASFVLGSSPSEVLLSVLALAGIPAILIGVILASFLFSVLKRNQSLSTRLVTCCVSVSISLGVSFIVLIALYTVSDSVANNSATIDGATMLYSFGFVFGVVATGALIFVPLCFWIKLLGYELIASDSEPAKLESLTAN